MMGANGIMMPSPGGVPGAGLNRRAFRARPGPAARSVLVLTRSVPGCVLMKNALPMHVQLWLARLSLGVGPGAGRWWTKPKRGRGDVSPTTPSLVLNSHKGRGRIYAALQRCFFPHWISFLLLILLLVLDSCAVSLSGSNYMSSAWTACLGAVYRHQMADCPL